MYSCIQLKQLWFGALAPREKPGSTVLQTRSKNELACLYAIPWNPNLPKKRTKHDIPWFLLSFSTNIASAFSFLLILPCSFLSSLRSFYYSTPFSLRITACTLVFDQYVHNLLPRWNYFQEFSTGFSLSL